ncbi:hypothetical protein [Photobacterium leiognathi]|uniref:hypothetical protein n=1 Tax=Photobacterium leiognathi TaxID=553611 RepID=UPI00273A1CB5|nr:hypothetical protein [Photobacterium leiognathi]
MSKLKAVTVVVRHYPLNKPKSVAYRVIPLIEMLGELAANDKSRSIMSEYTIKGATNYRILGEKFTAKDVVNGLVKEFYSLQKGFEENKAESYSYICCDKASNMINRPNGLSASTTLYPSCLPRKQMDNLMFVQISSTNIENDIRKFKSPFTMTEDSLVVSDGIVKKPNNVIVRQLLPQVYTLFGMKTDFDLKAAVFIDNKLVYSDIDDEVIPLKKLVESVNLNEMIETGCFNGIMAPFI